LNFSDASSIKTQRGRGHQTNTDWTFSGVTQAALFALRYTQWICQYGRQLKGTLLRMLRHRSPGWCMTVSFGV